MVANPLADVQPVRIGQHDVEQDQIRPLAPAELHRALTRLRSDQDEAFFLQVVLEQREQIGVVLDEQYLLHYGYPTLRLP